METINENKKILEWFRDHADKVLTIFNIVFGTYILFLGLKLSISLYLKIVLVSASIFYFWLGYYTYREGVQ